MTGTLFAELKRRKVVKVGAVYLVAAWLAVQAASIGFPAFDAPPWALRVFLLVLLLGFPIVVVLTWVLDVTPEGVRVEPSSVGNKRVIGVAIALAVLGVAWYFFGQPSVRPGQSVVDAATAKPASPAPAPPVDNKSIAVLAFSDLSPKHDQDYFSDGMSEEILNALAQIRDLRVAGRTSSFYYKGRNEDLRTIGKALGVAHVLEGSVRTQGNKVRITAQLIRSTDGIHLWSKQYDGDLSDVFKLQDQIARAIVDELQPVLEGAQKSRLVPQLTRSPEAYQIYLRATEILNKRDYARAKEGVAWLEQALKLDPDFVRAESQLAQLQAVVNVRDPRHNAEAERHARAAMAKDPALAQPVYVMGIALRYQRNFLEARPYLDRAVRMAPRDASAHMYLGQWLIVAGYTKQGIEEMDRAIAIDPMLPNAVNWRAYQYMYAGDIESAEALFRRTEALGLTLAKAGLGEIALSRGHVQEARKLMAMQPQVTQVVCGNPDPKKLDTLFAGTLGGDAAAQAKAVAIIDDCVDTKPAELPSWTVISLMRLQQYDRALDLLANRTSDDAGVGFRMWAPQSAAMRQRPAFAGVTDRFGWIDAWEKYGPPDLCTRVAPRQYRCR
jgi:TolB-like protein/Tfp pilus assembly protein PilF